MSTTETITETGEPLEYVYYHHGGVPGSRPILTGKNAKPTFTELPRIDMRRINSPNIEDRKELAAEVAAACRDVGFFYAVNHPVQDEVLDGTFEAMEKFFSLPHEIKMETHVMMNKKFRGYEPLLATKLDPRTRGDLKEGYLMGEDATDPEQHDPSSPWTSSMNRTPRNQWPTHPSAAFFRPAIYRYHAAMLAFAKRLLRIFALALDQPEDYFDPITTFPMTNIRALHYPPQTLDSDVGIGAHTDFVWFTLVPQSITKHPALEVLNGNGIFVPALPERNSFVVNVGDFLSMATGGHWQSTVHRVRNRNGEDRYSIPFFLTPDEDAEISVVEKFRKDGVKYKTITTGEYFEERLQVDRRTNERVALDPRPLSEGLIVGQ